MSQPITNNVARAACLAVAVLTVLSAGAARAQETAAEPTPSFGADTALVRLDVVVRDKHGRVVRDLEASDFELFEDGAAQRLDSFRIVSRESPAGPQAPSPAAEAAMAPVPGASREEPPVVVAFVFDRMSPMARSLARRAALAHVDAGQVRGCVAGVFAIDLALHAVEPFTTDESRLRAAIDRAAGALSTDFSQDSEDARRRIDSVLERSDLLTHLGDGQQGAVADTAATLAVKNIIDTVETHVLRASEAMARDQQGYATMNGLLGVVELLERVPGRKAIVLLSEGLELPANVLGRFRTLVAAANRAQVSVYALDAGGLRARSPLEEGALELKQIARVQAQDATSDIRLSMGPMTRQLERAEDLVRFDPRSGLGQLAEETGGLLIHDSNDPAEGFARIGEDLRFHYLLSYAPTNQKQDGHFRKISVRVRRPGLQVQARKGYFARPAPVPAGPEALALAQLDRSPRPASLDLRLMALSFPEARRPGLVPVLVEVPEESLHYGPAADGGTRADVAVVVRIRDGRGQEVARLGDRYLIPPGRPEAPRGPLQFYREVDLAPGRYTIESVAFDAGSQAAGVRSFTLDVPKIVDHELRLSSLVLASGADAAPDASGRNPLQFGGVFLRPHLGQPLRKSQSPLVGFFFAAYGDPHMAKSREASIELRRGERTLTRSRAELPSFDADGRAQHAGTLALGELEPGPYTLAVTVTDGERSDTRQAAFVLER